MVHGMRFIHKKGMIHWKKEVFSKFTKTVLPITDINLSVNFWLDEKQRAFGFVREVSTESQPEGVDVYETWNMGNFCIYKKIFYAITQIQNGSKWCSRVRSFWYTISQFWFMHIWCLIFVIVKFFFLKNQSFHWTHSIGLFDLKWHQKDQHSV